MRTFTANTLFTLALAVPFISIAPAHAFPIPCPDGSSVEFGQFCPSLKVNCADGSQVGWGQFCPAAVKPDETPAPNNLPDDKVLNDCSINKGVWNTEKGMCEYPNDVAAAQKAAQNQCSLNKGVWNTELGRCDIL